MSPDRGARAITWSTFVRLLPVNRGVQRLFKGRQCSGKLKSDLRKFGLFVAFKWFKDCLWHVISTSPLRMQLTVAFFTLSSSHLSSSNLLFLKNKNKFDKLPIPQVTVTKSLPYLSAARSVLFLYTPFQWNFGILFAAYICLQEPFINKEQRLI